MKQKTFLRGIAVFEDNEALEVLWRVGGLYPLGASAIKLHEVDVGIAGLEGTRRVAAPLATTTSAGL